MESYSSEINSDKNQLDMSLSRSEIVKSLKNDRDFFDHKCSRLKKLFLVPFFNHINACLDDIKSSGKVKNSIDIGCGKGCITEYIQTYTDITGLGIDISENKIRFAKHMYPHMRFEKTDCEDIVSLGKTFDLLICTEVLEHQEHPEKLLSLFDKISDKYILLSVPHEPYRSRSNLMRGKYISRGGTTPDHKQKYTKSSFQKTLNDTLPGREINVQSKGFRLIAIAKKL